MIKICGVRFGPQNGMDNSLFYRGYSFFLFVAKSKIAT